MNAPETVRETDKWGMPSLNTLLWLPRRYSWIGPEGNQVRKKEEAIVFTGRSSLADAKDFAEKFGWDENTYTIWRE